MRKYANEVKNLIKLAVPILFAQGSQTAIGVVDTIMAGGVSEVDLAAVAIGSSIWLPVILFGAGLLMALTPIVAQLNGSGRRERIAHPVTQSFWLGALLSVITIFIIYHCQYLLEFMGKKDPEMIRISVGYLHTLMWGAPAYYGFQILRDRCEGLSNTKPGMVIAFIALIINIPINYIFIYGKLGMPALGGIGCGVASAAVYWLMFFMIYLYTKYTPTQRDIRKHAKFEWPNFSTLSRITRIGLPMALALLFEVSLFAVVALLITPLGAIAVSAHQTTLSFSGLIFVIPLSLGIASTIRVGHLLGEKRLEQAKLVSRTAIALGLSISFVSAACTVLYRENIAQLYSSNLDVLTLASQLMFFAAIYQCSDSIQIIGNGVLRGYKDTKAIFYITFIAYWIIGLPSGYLLGLTDWLVTPMGPKGFWLGFIFGLSASAVMMSLRILWLQRQPAEKVLKQVGF